MEGERSNTVNHIIFHKNIDPHGHLSLSSDSLCGFQYPLGQGPSEAEATGIIGNNIFGTLCISAPDFFEVSTAADGFYSSSLQLEPTSTQLRNMVFFRLKCDLPEGVYSQYATLIANNLHDSIALVGHVWGENSIPTIVDHPFAYCDGNSLVVNGTGELQIIDIVGRKLFSFNIHNSTFVMHHSEFPASGVYILRLCGDTVRSQKIVIQTPAR